MMSNSPHYLLFSEASRNDRSAHTWRFVLQNVESQRRFTATDSEPTDCGERLELLAVVRGLEALEGPARVTLVTKSRYVSRGMKSGLAEWRANDWCWERFGRIVPVRDRDLWQRVDRALRFHQVDCQIWQFDEQPCEEPKRAASPASPLAARPRIQHRVSPRCRPRPTKRKATNMPAARSNSMRERLRAFVHGVSRWSEALRVVTRPMRQAFGAAA